MIRSGPRFGVRINAAQLREKMKRTAEKCNIAADRLTACRPLMVLVDNRLENGGGQILFGCAFVDERLDIRLGENAAARRDRIDCLVIFAYSLRPDASVRKQRSHLINKEPVPPAQIPFIRWSMPPVK